MGTRYAASTATLLMVLLATCPARAEVLFAVQGEGGSSVVAVHPGDTFTLWTELTPLSGETVGGAFYMLMFGRDDLVLNSLTYGPGWYTSGYFDNSVPHPSDVTGPVTITPDLYAPTPTTADIRFDVGRPLGQEATAATVMEELEIHVPVDTALGSYSIQFGTIEACSATGVPFPVQTGGAFELRVRRVNHAPSCESACIVPAPAWESSTLSIVCTGWFDEDGDSEGYHYQWRVNDEDVTGATGATLGNALFRQGDTVRCVVTPWDGEAEGTAVETAPVTIGWAFAIQIPEGSPATVEFGMRADATPDFDAAFDAVAVKDPEMACVCLFNAAVTDPAKQDLASDFRPVGGMTTRWRLVVDVPENRAEGCDLSWSFGATQPEKELYLQRLAGETPVGAPVDMNVATSLAVTEDSVFEVTYSELVDAHFALQQGWNLTGFAVMTLSTVAEAFDDGHRGSLKAGAVWQWTDAGLHPMADTDVLNPERGYWVYSPAGGESQPVAGLVADGTISLVPGWNLVAPVTACPLPANRAIRGPAWGWDTAKGRYEPVYSLDARKGYWIYVGAGGCLLQTGE